MSNAATDLAARVNAICDDALLPLSANRRLALRQVAALLDAFAPILTLDWPCPTCGGMKRIGLPYGSEPCPNPDCVDGQVSPAERVKQLIAEHQAIWEFPIDERLIADESEALVVHMVKHFRGQTALSPLRQRPTP